MTTLIFSTARQLTEAADLLYPESRWNVDSYFFTIVILRDDSCFIKHVLPDQLKNLAWMRAREYLFPPLSWFLCFIMHSCIWDRYRCHKANSIICGLPTIRLCIFGMSSLFCKLLLSHNIIMGLA